MQVFIKANIKTGPQGPGKRVKSYCHSYHAPTAFNSFVHCRPQFFGKPLITEKTTYPFLHTAILHIWLLYRKLKHFPKIQNVFDGYTHSIQQGFFFCELCVLMPSITKGGHEWLKALNAKLSTGQLMNSQ